MKTALGFALLKELAVAEATTVDSGTVILGKEGGRIIGAPVVVQIDILKERCRVHSNDTYQQGLALVTGHLQQQLELGRVATFRAAWAFPEMESLVASLACRA